MIKSIGFDCVLFENCNLNCKHCFQNHTNNIINEKYIESLPSIVYPAMVEEIKLKKPEIIILSIRGGEIFQDKFSDELLEKYASFILKVREMILNDYPNIKFICHFMSNAIYYKIDRVINFLKKVNGIITLSFDAYGRYTSDEQYQLFLKNYNILNKEGLVRNIGITLTKQSIQKYIEDINLLKQFYQTEIDINYYIPTAKDAELASDEDLFNFFKNLLDNKIFNSIYLKNVLNNHIKNSQIYPSCGCANTTVIYDGKIYKTCNIYVPSLKLEDFYREETSNVNEINGVKIITKLGMQKRGCILCKYYNNCSFYCWMMLNYKNYKMSECPHKKIHEYIDSNPNIIKEYKQWLQK